MRSTTKVMTAMAALVLLVSTGAWGQADRDKEAAVFLDALRSTSASQRVDALKRITRSGLTDEALFAHINSELLARYPSVSGPDQVDELSWMCKALASSGLPQYKETLSRVASTTQDLKLKQYAEQSLGLVDQHARRNAAMAQAPDLGGSVSPEAARLIAMVRSGDARLQKDAAKTVTRGKASDPALYDALADLLLQGYQTDQSNAEWVDTLSWVCKALATSGDAKHRQAIETVARAAANPKLQRYAQQSL